MGPVETAPTKTKNQQQRKKAQMHNPVTELAKYKRFIINFIPQCLLFDLEFLPIPLQICSL